MATRHVSFRHAVELLQRDSPALVASPSVAVRTAAVAFTPNADEVALLDQVIEHYHTTLQESSEARAYLNSRGLDHPELVAHFRLGYANRTLGYRLPEKNRVAGAELRGAVKGFGFRVSYLPIPLQPDNGGVARGAILATTIEDCSHRCSATRAIMLHKMLHRNEQIHRN